MIKSGTSKRKFNQVEKEVKREKLSCRDRLLSIKEKEDNFDINYETIEEDDDICD